LRDRVGFMKSEEEDDPEEEFQNKPSAIHKPGNEGRLVIAKDLASYKNAMAKQARMTNKVCVHYRNLS
jgi:hypothetical protein